MKEFIRGLRKYTDEVYPKQTQLFAELANGQQPHTLFITCSDSRIDPNLITQTDPGEIFVIRNAGNIVPQYGASHGGEEPTIEYAIEGLKVKNIVVCGHSQCGAMGALLNKGSLEKLPAVAKWLDHAEPTLKRLEGKHELPHAVEQNTLAQIESLKTHPSVSGAISRGEIKLFACTYKFETGETFVFSPSENTFVKCSSISDETDFSRFSL